MSPQQSKSSRAEKSAAKERVAAMRAEEARRERRQKLLIYGVAGLVVVLIAALVAYQMVQQGEEEDRLAADIEGLQEFEIADREHVAGAVDYEAEYGTNPPAGGNHAESPQWQNCGIYDTPIGSENAVHSLEHGAVWITYQPDLPEDQVEALRDVVRDLDSSESDYVIVSPFEGLTSPVVASAWGLQVSVDDPSDERLDQFLHQYVRGPQTLEPGAACQGGVGSPIE
ncbi:MAG TPA: DUF3105 domain-containing protein [Jiangellaceae bacterium]